MKKWLPLIIILSIALFSFLNLILFTDDPYKPTTDDPQVIYYEACATCHGDNGQGDGILYPSLEQDSLSVKEIEDIIVNGSWLMPRFNNIKKDTLATLVEFIHKQNFEN